MRDSPRVCLGDRPGDAHRGLRGTEGGIGARHRQRRVRLGGRDERRVGASGCKSWYQTPSGRNVAIWPGFTFEFRRRTRHFDLARYDVVHTAELALPAQSPVRETAALP